MQLQIHPLVPERLEDYLKFFDKTAFSDNPEWAGCYCTYFYCGKADEKRLALECAGGPVGPVLRRMAADLVNRREMRGYIAYLGGELVGWCSVNDKQAFHRLRENPLLWNATGENERVKAIVCFIVAPAHRRQGIAAALLDRAVQDAAREGYAAVEAYPLRGAHDCFANFHGYAAMYEKAGFRKVKELDESCVYRRRFSADSDGSSHVDSR